MLMMLMLIFVMYVGCEWLCILCNALLCMHVCMYGSICGLTMQYVAILLPLLLLKQTNNLSLICYYQGFGLQWVLY